MFLGADVVMLGAYTLGEEVSKGKVLSTLCVRAQEMIQPLDKSVRDGAI